MGQCGLCQYVPAELGPDPGWVVVPLSCGSVENALGMQMFLFCDGRTSESLL